MTDGFILPHTLVGMPPDTSVLVAFSGGADSSVLLHLLREHCGAKVFAAHVNHMIRGEEADRDEEFCRKVCKGLDIPLFVLRRAIPSYASELGVSIETAARRARYDFFDSLMAEHDIPILATAHNANDNLETLIFNITRGAGLSGACGIPPTRKCKNGTVVRPILTMCREDILRYCRDNEIDYVTDSTNLDTDYTRNKIRAEIIPSLMKINPSVVKNASRMCASLREDELCLRSLSDMFCEMQMRDDASFDIDKILAAPASVANRALMSLYESMSGGVSLEYVHIEAIRELCRRGVPHSRVSLPAELCARIENRGLYIEPNTEKSVPSEDFCLPLDADEITISQINAKIIMQNSHNSKNIYKTEIPLYLDFDKICGVPNVRNRRPSDKIRIRGVNKSVKKLLCDLHIPLEIRYRLPMICDGETVVAIPSVGIADGYTLQKGAEPSMIFTLL